MYYFFPGHYMKKTDLILCIQLAPGFDGLDPSAYYIEPLTQQLGCQFFGQYHYNKTVLVQYHGKPLPL